MLFGSPFQSDKLQYKKLIDLIIYCIMFTITLFTFICYNLVL